jgi:hypothetical protein
VSSFSFFCRNAITPPGNNKANPMIPNNPCAKITTIAQIINIMPTVRTFLIANTIAKKIIKAIIPIQT